MILHVGKYTKTLMESTNDSQSNNEFTPRAYQIDLYERAIQNNTIIYLPTGGGKTYIAVMLLKYLSKDLHMYVSSFARNICN